MSSTPDPLTLPTQVWIVLWHRPNERTWVQRFCPTESQARGYLKHVDRQGGQGVSLYTIAGRPVRRSLDIETDRATVYVSHPTDTAGPTTPNR